MKKDCTYTRKSLQKYLRGHLFKYEQIKIARHLNACPICRSEFQALKKVADTKRLLQDITPPEGVVQQLRAGAGALGQAEAPDVPSALASPHRQPRQPLSISMSSLRIGTSKLKTLKRAFPRQHLSPLH